ncbi:MAG TPA: sialidase family protein, partial [Acidimicrobiales bacterium]|nr:sialidase family protein [Acidimicrobiales bacterium]
TFGAPVNVAAAFNADPANIPADVPEDRRRPENFGGSNLSLAVDAGGAVYGAWGRSTANITPAPPGVTVLSRSADGGATWTSSLLLAADPNRTGPSGLTLAWAPAGGPNGSLHTVWEGKLTTVQGDRDTLYQRSVDEGRTWSEPRLLNDDDPAELFGQFQPSLAVAPNGRLEVAWWDMRDSAGLFATDVYGVSSTDNGETWSANRRITDRIIDRTIGVWKPGTGGDVRQPPGLAAADALTVVMWDDTRNGSPQVETQDLFAATVQYSALARTSGLSRTAGYLLAGSIGVLAVGLVLAIGSVVMRGRNARGPAAPAASGRAPVEVG